MADERTTTSSLNDENVIPITPNSENVVPITPNKTTLIAINSNQLLDKLTPSNYPTWKASKLTCFFLAIIFLVSLKERNPALLKTKSVGGTKVLNPEALLWKYQDQLLRHGILISLSDRVRPMVSSSKTSAEAWSWLNKLYANASSSHTVGLTDQLSNI